MTISELKSQAKNLKSQNRFQESMELYEKLWALEQNEWNGYFLAQSYRKIDNFDKARELHNYLGSQYPNFKPLQNDKLWLDYSEKIKDWDNPDLISDAENILNRSNKYDKYTGSVFNKTVLNVVRYLIFKNDYITSYDWLQKLDHSVINSSVFQYNGEWYPSDRKVFFIRLADVLIKLDTYKEYIQSCFEKLNFSDLKINEFSKYLFEDITFDDYISRVKLARHIKNFQEEITLRDKKNFSTIFNPKKTTLVSDLSHYLFCPVSFSIMETFKINANHSWEKDEWLGDKKNLSDRYLDFANGKNYQDIFSDSGILINEKLENDFDFIFKSKIISNNIDNPSPQIISNNDKSLFGAPDYILKSADGKKYAVTEKYSSIYSADTKTPFESDLVKHYAFLDEFKNEELEFGYFITWYWELKNIETNRGKVKKKIVINSYRILKVERNNINSNKLKKVIHKVASFKKNKAMEIDANKISFPNKCFNCTVFSYCNHKTGNFNTIDLPYALEDKKEPNQINIDDDDLPF